MTGNGDGSSRSWKRRVSSGRVIPRGGLEKKGRDALIQFVLLSNLNDNGDQIALLKSRKIKVPEVLEKAQDEALKAWNEKHPQGCLRGSRTDSKAGSLLNEESRPFFRLYFLRTEIGILRVHAGKACYRAFPL